jgi:hypothetical protein
MDPDDRDTDSPTTPASDLAAVFFKRMYAPPSSHPPAAAEHRTGPQDLVSLMYDPETKVSSLFDRHHVPYAEFGDNTAFRRLLHQWRLAVRLEHDRDALGGNFPAAITAESAGFRRALLSAPPSNLLSRSGASPSPRGYRAQRHLPVDAGGKLGFW